jgi:hypothetical protein
MGKTSVAKLIMTIIDPNILVSSFSEESDPVSAILSM